MASALPRHDRGVAVLRARNDGKNAINFSYGTFRFGPIASFSSPAGKRDSHFIDQEAAISASTLVALRHGFTAAIQSAWEDSLQRIRRVGAIILGVPSDTGAGILRGACFGPLGIREAYLQQFGQYPKSAVDVGDVLCVPQLLHDEMLSSDQMAATRRELYPGKEEPLPVSPLSITEQVLMALYELNPEAQILILGGDQSVSWPAMLYCHRRCGEDFGVLHFDAQPESSRAPDGD